jgi:hypothetical protein
LSTQPLPGFSSLGEAASRVANSAAFKNLSPAGQDLVDKYFRMMSSIPEYQKASTGIGRTNKEMLDLELKNRRTFLIPQCPHV